MIPSKYSGGVRSTPSSALTVSSTTSTGTSCRRCRKTRGGKAMFELTLEQVRILGCLLEKERTVPDSYPMTLNGLVTACNQSSNRSPVVSYEPGDVQRALDDLK